MYLQDSCKGKSINPGGCPGTYGQGNSMDYYIGTAEEIVTEVLMFTAPRRGGFCPQYLKKRAAVMYDRKKWIGDSQMGITKWIVKAAAPLPKLESFEKFLFIGPHPDDIEVGAGATAARLAAEGKQICFLICTDGRFGLGNAPEGTTPEELAAILRTESVDSASVLGVRDVRFLGFSDGALYRKKDLFSEILKVIGSFQPDVILAPDPDVASECHPDHLNVGYAAKRAACFAPYEEIMRSYGASAAPVKAVALYMTAKANCFIGTAGYFPVQQKALFSCHASQFPEGSPEAASISLYLKVRALDFGVRSFHRTAEGFRVLGQTQMHCLPEAGE